MENSVSGTWRDTPSHQVNCAERPNGPLSVEVLVELWKGGSGAGGGGGAQGACSRRRDALRAAAAGASSGGGSGGERRRASRGGDAARWVLVTGGRQGGEAEILEAVVAASCTRPVAAHAKKGG